MYVGERQQRWLHESRDDRAGDHRSEIVVLRHQQFSEWKTLLLAGGIGFAVYTAYAIMWVVAIDSFW